MVDEAGPHGRELTYDIEVAPGVRLLKKVPEENYEAPEWLPGLLDELIESEHEPEAAADLPRRDVPRLIQEARSEAVEAAATDERPPAHDSRREEPRPRLRPVWRPASPPGGLAGSTRVRKCCCTTARRRVTPSSSSGGGGDTSTSCGRMQAPSLQG